MIPKLICFIFGCKKREKKYIDFDRRNEVATYNWIYFDYCPRCDKKLKMI